jgi:hypothetical protein
MFDDILNKYFSSLGVSLTKSFIRNTSGVISACSFSTHEIARHVSKITGHDFNTSEKGLHYLLSNEHFQIDDHYWRQHINMVFDLMLEQEIIKKNEKIYLQIDYTTSEDYFLILVVSVIVNNRSVPLYFTMRNYPKCKNQYNHKKMEQAFLKGLRHVLSKKFVYVIVADRGFCNERFLGLCEENEFDYIIRATPNLKIKHRTKQGLMDEICLNDGAYESDILHWKKSLTISKCSNEKGSWYLLSNLKCQDHKEVGDIYKHRFKIEKCFQDLKSSGFNIEKTKIRKYSKYKRLLAIIMVAHVLLVLLGHVIAVKLPSFLKNSALMADVILAYFLSEERLVPYLQASN